MCPLFCALILNLKPRCLNLVFTRNQHIPPPLLPSQLEHHQNPSSIILSPSHILNTPSFLEFYYDWSTLLISGIEEYISHIFTTTNNTTTTGVQQANLSPATLGSQNLPIVRQTGTKIFDFYKQNKSPIRNRITDIKMCVPASRDRLHGAGKRPKNHPSHMDRLRAKHNSYMDRSRAKAIHHTRIFQTSLRKVMPENQERAMAARGGERRRRRLAAPNPFYLTLDSTPDTSDSDSDSTSAPSPPLATFRYFPRLPEELQMMVLSNLLISADEIPIDDKGRPNLARDLVPPPDLVTTTFIIRYVRNRDGGRKGRVTRMNVTTPSPDPAPFSSTWLTNYLLVSSDFRDMCSRLYFTRNVFGLHAGPSQPGIISAPGLEEFLYGRRPAAVHFRTRVRGLALHLGGLGDKSLPPFLATHIPSLRSLIPHGGLRRLWVFLDEPSSSLDTIAENYKFYGSLQEENYLETKPEMISTFETVEKDALWSTRSFFHYVVPHLLRLLRRMVLKGPDPQGDEIETEGRLMAWAPYHFRQLCGYHEKGFASKECEKVTFELRGCKTDRKYLEVDLQSLAAKYPLWHHAGDKPQYRMGWNIMKEGA